MGCLASMGGIAFALGVLQNRWYQDTWLSVVLVLLGAAIGGFSIARVSPVVRTGRAMAVNATLMASLLAVVLALFGTDLLPDAEPLATSLILRLIVGSGLGTLGGTILGRHWQPDTDRFMVWAACSMLVTTGILGLTGGIFIALLSLHPGNLGLLHLVLVDGVCMFLGGMTTQYMAPTRRRGPIGLGAAGALLVFVPQILSIERVDPSEPGPMFIMVLGLLPLMAASTLPAFLGAACGWHVARKQERSSGILAETAEVSLPHARIR